MASLAINPLTSDAAIRCSGSSFANARAGTGTKSVISAATTTYGFYADNGSTPGTYIFDRLLMPFDTRSLNGATITAATLDVNVTGGAAPFVSGPIVDLISGTPADPTSIATADFTAVTNGTALATEQTWAAGAAGAKTFTLNATGRSAINVSGGYTTLVLVAEPDFSNSNANIQFDTLNMYGTLNSSDSASNKPLLTITYTPAAVGGSSPRRRPRGLYTR